MNNFFKYNDLIESDLEYMLLNLSEEMVLLKGKSILITGGAGFLGYYFCELFKFWNAKQPLESKITVYIFDNFSRGRPSWLNSYESDPFFIIEKFDINSSLNPSYIFNYIIHAASIASPIFYRKFPIETMDANVNGLRNLLNFSILQNARGYQLDGFLYFSTSEIYGDPDPANIPTSETYRGNVSCTGPRACYDESKRYGETLCVNFAKVFGLPLKVARPFNNYGPGLPLNDGRALADIVSNILTNSNVVLHSDGSPTRTFCYIADAIVGYVKVLTVGTPGEAYNIGVDGPEISIKELAEKTIVIARNLFGYNGHLVTETSTDKDYLVDNPNRRCPNIYKARADLKFNPRIPLDIGLYRSLIWYAELK